VFDTLIVQPIFNLLVFIYGIIPGHDWGLAIIVFTIIIRALMWPMVKKQLHNTRALRAIQPDIKKVRDANKGDKQLEAKLLMELYKERGVSPFSALGGLLIQLPVLIGLFSAIRKLISDPAEIGTFTYSFVRDLPFIQDVIADLTLFDKSLFGVIDLSKRAFEGGTIYLPLMALALLSAILQYYQARQLSPSQSDGRKLRDILKSSADGKQADQSEINAAMARNTMVLFPILTGIFSATFPGSLALYWASGSIIALAQNKFVLGSDVEETNEATPVEVVAKPPKKAKKITAKKKQSRKQRKRGN